MFVVSRDASHSIESLPVDDAACEPHVHALEVLHQWRALQGALKTLAASESASSRAPAQL